MRPKKRNMFSVARKSPKSCFKQQTLPATAEGTPYFFGSDLLAYMRVFLNGYRRHTFGGNPATVQHPVQGGVAILPGMLHVKATVKAFGSCAPLPGTLTSVVWGDIYRGVSTSSTGSFYQKHKTIVPAPFNMRAPQLILSSRKSYWM